MAANLVSGTPSTTVAASTALTVVPAAATSTTSASTLPASQWQDCGKEGQECTVTGPTLVRYGIGNRFVIKEVTGRFACSNGVFGDPAWGSVKTCSILPATLTDRWVTCASEGQTCVVPGSSSTMVRYGANGRFAFKETSARIGCNNQVFGDPVWGMVKACAYRVAGTTQLTDQVELSSIPSNFDTAKYLVPSWGSGAIAATGKPDTVGAFRFICNPGQLLKDDPVVYPGQAGRSHLHQFFGNTGANANSTYASLRTTGESTCNNMLNRSAYWMPAMMNGKGKVVRPDYISIYYKRRPQNDPECLRQSIKGCRDLPRGLRYVFGYNMATDQGGGFHFNCDGPGAVSGHFPDIVSAAKGCPIGSRLGAIIVAPECWDGKNLDSPDHRSHMAYPDYGWWGYQKCPDTHPYVIPTFMMGAWYSTDADLDRSGSWVPSTSTWSLSSDTMAGMTPKRPGTTMHADWFGAWDDGVMQMWSTNCVDKLLSCAGGDLGNGKQLRMFDGFSWTANPRLVDPPA